MAIEEQRHFSLAVRPLKWANKCLKKKKSINHPIVWNEFCIRFVIDQTMSMMIAHSRPKTRPNDSSFTTENATQWQHGNCPFNKSVSMKTPRLTNGTIRAFLLLSESKSNYQHKILFTSTLRERVSKIEFGSCETERHFELDLLAPEITVI